MNIEVVSFILEIIGITTITYAIICGFAFFAEKLRDYFHSNSNDYMLVSDYNAKIEALCGSLRDAQDNIRNLHSILEANKLPIPEDSIIEQMNINYILKNTFYIQKNYNE